MPPPPPPRLDGSVLVLVAVVFPPDVISTVSEIGTPFELSVVTAAVIGAPVGVVPSNVF